MAGRGGLMKKVSQFRKGALGLSHCLVCLAAIYDNYNQAEGIEGGSTPSEVGEGVYKKLFQFGGAGCLTYG